MNMMMPDNIKRTYKILTGCIVVAIIIGVIFQMPGLYFGYPVGAFASILMFYTLHKEIHEMLYVQEKKIRSPFGYYKRLFIMICALVMVALVSRRYFPKSVEANIVCAGVGLLSLKLSLLINKRNK